MGNFGINVVEGRRKTHMFSATDHWETSAMARGQDMEDTWGRISSVSGRNAVINDLHREAAGNRSAVGRFVTNILSICRRDWL